MFKDMRKVLGEDIYFQQGLREVEPNLSNIDPCYNNIVVLDDLMDMAMDIPLFLNYSPKGDIETQASYCCYKMHFRKESTIPV